MSFKGEGVGKSWCGDGFTCLEPVGPGFFSGTQCHNNYFCLFLYSFLGGFSLQLVLQ